VRKRTNRVFANDDDSLAKKPRRGSAANAALVVIGPDNDEARNENSGIATLACESFCSTSETPEMGRNQVNAESLARRLREVVHRFRQNTATPSADVDWARCRIAGKNPKARIELSEDNLARLCVLCGVSEFFGEMLAGNPALISWLEPKSRGPVGRDYRVLVASAYRLVRRVFLPLNFQRCEEKWRDYLLRSALKTQPERFLFWSGNELQTELAVASTQCRYLIARRANGSTHAPLKSGPRLSIFSLWPVCERGVELWIDLDTTIVYDSLVFIARPSLTPDEAYAVWSSY